jgi:hypothetical protein
VAIAYSDLLTLRTAPDLFSVLAGMLRGAMADVAFERDGEVLSRAHLLSEVGEFPKVLIAVQGSTSRPQERQFFALPEIYRNTSWELASAEDEATVLTWVRDNGSRDLAREREALAERDRLLAAWRAEALAARTEAERAEARERLRQAAAAPAPERRWQAVVRDLRLVEFAMTRKTDRDFIESLSKVQAVYGGFRLTEGRISWLSDVLKRAVAGFGAG